MHLRMGRKEYVDWISKFKEEVVNTGYFNLDTAGKWHETWTSETSTLRRDVIRELIGRLMKGAKEARIYGSRFNESSFDGQGEIALQKTVRRRGYFEVNIRDESTQELTDFWLNRGSERPSGYSGEAYFYFDSVLDVPNIFELCVGPKIISNIKAHSSKAGFEAAMQYGASHGPVVCVGGGRFVTLFAGKDLDKLVLGAAAFSRRITGDGDTVSPADAYEIVASEFDLGLAGEKWRI